MSRDAILIHGKPGSGKTSAAQELTPIINKEFRGMYFHISVGKLLRNIATGESASAYTLPVRRQLEELNKARPLDHSLVTDIVAERFDSLPVDSVALLDGFPKYVEQVAPFERHLNLAGEILGLVGIEVPDEIAIDRIISRGNREAESSVDVNFAHQRLDEHARGYAKTMRYMSAHYKSHVIDGTQPLPSVVNELLHICRDLTRPNEEIER